MLPLDAHLVRPKTCLATEPYFQVAACTIATLFWDFGFPANSEDRILVGSSTSRTKRACLPWPHCRGWIWFGYMCMCVFTHTYCLISTLYLNNPDCIFPNKENTWPDNVGTMLLRNIYDTDLYAVTKKDTIEDAFCISKRTNYSYVFSLSVNVPHIIQSFKTWDMPAKPPKTAQFVF